MQFHRFNARNLFSLGNVHVDLNNRGLVLVTGYSHDEGSSNGSGKSSLINKGLLWALFGETAEGLKTEEVINRYGALRHDEKSRVARVTLSFILNDNYYLIRRERSVKGTKLSLESNNESIGCREVKETQTRIEQLIGHNIKTFIQTDVFGQGNRSPFMKLTPAGQKDIIESILPFNELDIWLENTKKSKKALATRVTEIQQQIIASQEVLKSLKGQRDSVRSQSSTWEVNKANTITRLTKDLVEIENSDVTLEINTIQKTISEMPNDLDKKAFTCIDEISRLTERKNECLKNDKETADRIEYYKTLLIRDACPTCHRSWKLTDEEKEQVSDKLSFALATKNASTGNIEYYNIQLENKQRQYELIKDLNNNLEMLNSRLSSLNVEEETRKITVLKEQIEQIKSSKNPFLETLNRLDTTISERDNILGTCGAKLETIKKEEGIVNLWEKAYAQDLRISLYDQVCPFLESRANYHLQKLNNAQISVTFSTNKTLKNDTIKTEFTVLASSMSGGSSYELLSGGEQQMVDFAVGLALSDLAATQAKQRSNILILDEPFVGLDARNSESIVSYLKDEVSKVKDSIFLISNEETLKGLIPSQIHMEKRHGLSNIV